MKKIRIGMKMYANLVVVHSDLWSIRSNGFRDFILAIDTGSSKTVIDKAVLQKAGYNVDSGRVHKITTASKVEQINEVAVDKLQIGDLVIENMVVYAHSFPAELFISGLLGLDVLSQFDVNFLFSKRVIEFTEINCGDYSTERREILENTSKEEILDFLRDEE